jgi:threonyl-tRNA synthetase
MRETLKEWEAFNEKEVSVKEVYELFKDNPYKIELVDDIVIKGEKISIYTSGHFFDLCRDGHVEDPQAIDLESFKLDRVAGAYWRGDEKTKC